MLLLKEVCRCDKCHHLWLPTPGIGLLKRCARCDSRRWDGGDSTTRISTKIVNGGDSPLGFLTKLENGGNTGTDPAPVDIPRPTPNFVADVGARNAALLESVDAKRRGTELPGVSESTNSTVGGNSASDPHRPML